MCKPEPMEWRGGPYPRATANLSHQAPMNTVAVSTANPVECQHGYMEYRTEFVAERRGFIKYHPLCKYDPYCKKNNYLLTKIEKLYSLCEISIFYAPEVKVRRNDEIWILKKPLTLNCFEDGAAHPLGGVKHIRNVISRYQQPLLLNKTEQRSGVIE